MAAFRGASRTFWSQYPRAPTTGLLKNPSFCTATRDPSREPSREPSKTQPPQGLSPLTLHCLLHDFVGLSPLPRRRVFTRMLNFTPINHRFCVIGAPVPLLAPSPPPPCLFKSTVFNVLLSMLLHNSPHARRGRRTRMGCAHCRRPRETRFPCRASRRC